MDLTALAAWRAERDRTFTDYASPLPEDHLDGFTGLRYFAPDPGLVCRGPFHPAEGSLPLEQSDGSTMRYATAGTVDLVIAGTAWTLVVLAAEADELFVPFGDATSGTETYGGGRYAPIERHEDGTATVDFNRTVNPLCAYDPEFSCPLPPPRNRLPMPVRAGEMDYVPPGDAA